MAHDRDDTKFLDQETQAALLDQFRRAQQRLIFLDYDGTLVPFAPRPEGAIPTERVLRVLERLGGNPSNRVVIISGRDWQTLEGWLGDLPVALVAEHGVRVRERGGGWAAMQGLSNHWKTEVRPLLDRYVTSLPDSFVEEKEFSLAWHYRNADAGHADALGRRLLDELQPRAGTLGVQILPGNKVIEVRARGVDKGTTGGRWLSPADSDFILAIGDDRTDEDLFKALPSGSCTIKVGPAPTCARFRLANPDEVLDLLERLAAS